MAPEHVEDLVLQRSALEGRLAGDELRDAFSLIFFEDARICCSGTAGKQHLLAVLSLFGPELTGAHLEGSPGNPQRARRISLSNRGRRGAARGRRWKLIDDRC